MSRELRWRRTGWSPVPLPWESRLQRRARDETRRILEEAGLLDDHPDDTDGPASTGTASTPDEAETALTISGREIDEGIELGAYTITVSPDKTGTAATGNAPGGRAQEEPQAGMVFTVGPGRIDDKGNRVPLDVAVGDVVIYSKYGGTEIKYNGEEYIILSARDATVTVSATKGRLLPSADPEGLEQPTDKLDTR